MTTPKSLLQKPAPLNPSQVADYLAQHPDFFMDRDELLRNLHLPHIHGGDVSLVERQVSLLRERNRDMRKQLETLVSAATINNDIFSKCQRLVLSLLEAQDSEAFYKALEQSFKRDFKCNAYSLLVFNDDARQINHFTYSVPESAAREYVGALMKSKKPTLGVLRPSEQDFLFRHASAKVKSAAVLSVRTAATESPQDNGVKGQQMALLAIGSSDAHYFQAGMGTVFIGFIADVLARQLPMRLAAP
jgi:uncharacterized protein YigA (DUF484 family)